MAWNDNLYTVDYGNNKWMIAKLTRVDAAGYHVENSSGHKWILPSHTVSKLTKREGW